MTEPFIHLENVYFSYGDPGGATGEMGSGDSGSADAGLSDPAASRRVPLEEEDLQPAHWVLRGVSLDVYPGEWLAILGQNGSGKSTLAKHLNGLLIPQRGTVRVAGLDTSDRRHIEQIRRRVGMVFQDPDNQIIAATVEEDVAFGLENLALPREEMRRRVEESLRWVGMWDDRKRSPHHLSGGQKQRVAIAGVLAMQPACIVLDEATSMLDTPGRKEVMAVAADLRRAGVTVVAVTHHMEEAVSADRIVVIHQGQVVLEGRPDEVFGQSQDRLAALHLDVPPAAAISRRIQRVLPGFPMCLETETLSREIERRVTRQPGVPSQAPEVRKPEDPPEESPKRDSAAKAGPVIAAQGLGYVYMKKTPLEHRALRDVNLVIPRGSITALVGHTGSGKSTLVQHFNGLIQVQEGQLTVKVSGYEDPRRDWKILRTRVGLVFQQPEDQLFERLVGDDVAFGPWQLGLAIEEVRERVRRALNVVGIPFEWKDRPIYALSGGQRRKVAIAGVLALNPEVLVLDEPTAGLDPRSGDELLEHLLRLNREEGLTLILITHNLTEVARFADRVILMEAGTDVWSGTPDELFADPELCALRHVGVPPHVELVHRLRERGVPIEVGGYSPEAVTEALVKRLLPEPGVGVRGVSR